MDAYTAIREANRYHTDTTVQNGKTYTYYVDVVMVVRVLTSSNEATTTIR